MPKKADTYQIELRGKTLDVTVTLFGDDYFIDRIELSHDIHDIWPLLKELEDAIRDKVDEAIERAGGRAYEAMQEERAENMRAAA